ncbi:MULTISPECIES: two-component system response regulator [unclassified Pseudomonas]|uniref:response regulator n=1 Tax=unclassified Pseudomonas TaxID=196821 RepID=UPI0009E95A87|nr:MULTISPECIES: two-component system response regulator [unclassified Pseudomonas]WPN44539.1 two-component system response regulator [Pseudomonas sp. P8_241]
MNRPTHRPTVLVVDDMPANLQLISELLGERYHVRVASSGAQALKSVERSMPDLILLDVVMPEMDGHDVCRTLKSDPKLCDVPVLFLSARNQDEDECLGFELGAADYLNKPINPPILLARVQTQIRLKATTDLLRLHNDYLDKEVVARTRELQATHDVTILALASLAETRDNETGNHLRRTQHYVRALAEKLRNHPRFRPYLDQQTIELMFKSAPLHDIGKVGIADQILLKPGRFEPAEFEIMKTHARLGYQALVHAEELLGAQVPFLRIAKEIALCHHEKWDGSGYPSGLAGEAIPVSARLMAVADVYDAVISRRVYKSEMTHQTAVAIIRDGAGRHFDPAVAAAFMALEKEFEQIAERYADTAAEEPLEAMFG